MELKKTNDRINRSYDEEGQGTDCVESANFNIVDADGNIVGNANISNGYGNANISINGFNTIEDGVAKLKDLLNIQAE